MNYIYIIFKILFYLYLKYLVFFFYFEYIFLDLWDVILLKLYINIFKG